MKIILRTVILLCALFLLLLGTSFADTGSTTASTLPPAGTGPTPIPGKISGTISWRYWAYPNLPTPAGYISKSILPTGGGTLVIGLWPDQQFRTGRAISYQALPVSPAQTSVDYKFAHLPPSKTGNYYLCAILYDKKAQGSEADPSGLPVGQYKSGSLPQVWGGTDPADQVVFTYPAQRTASGISFQLKAIVPPNSM